MNKVYKWYCIAIWSLVLIYAVVGVFVAENFNESFMCEAACVKQGYDNGYCYNLIPQERACEVEWNLITLDLGSGNLDRMVKDHADVCPYAHGQTASVDRQRICCCQW